MDEIRTKCFNCGAFNPDWGDDLAKIKALEAERDRYKAALEKIMARHPLAPCPAEGCGFPSCEFCIARNALKA